MQKAVSLFVLFAIVATSLAHHGGGRDRPMPNPPPTPPTQEIENVELTGGHRAARDAPSKMPSMEEMKEFAQDQISKLPEPVQDAIHKAQEMVAQKMKENPS